MRVLVVEDDPSVGAAIRMILDREGYETTIAPDADAGIGAFESLQFDLVLVDIFLPGKSGLSIIAEVGRRAPTVPILAMSGFRFRDSMEPGLDFLGMAALAGAVVCLRKPFESRQLIAAVRASLDRQLPVFSPQDRRSRKGQPSDV